MECNAEKLKKAILDKSAEGEKWAVVAAYEDSRSETRCACDTHYLKRVFEWRNGESEDVIHVGVEGCAQIDPIRDFGPELELTRAKPETASPQGWLLELATRIGVISPRECSEYTRMMMGYYSREDEAKYRIKINTFIVVGLLKSRPRCNCTPWNYAKCYQNSITEKFFYGCREWPDGCKFTLRVDNTGSTNAPLILPFRRKRCRSGPGPHISFPENIIGVLDRNHKDESSWRKGRVLMFRSTLAITGDSIIDMAKIPSTSNIVETNYDNTMALVQHEKCGLITLYTSRFEGGQEWFHCGEDTVKLVEWVDEMYEHFESEACKIYLAVDLLRNEGVYVARSQ